MISRGIPSKHHPQWGCFEKDQAEALASLGHKVIVLSVDARFSTNRGKLGLHHKSENGVEYYNYVVLPAIIFSKLVGEDRYINQIKFKCFNKVFNQITKEHGRPDIIYSQFFWNTAMAVKLKESYKIPVVGIEHLARFNNSNLSNQDYKWASYAFSGADTTIAVAKTLADNLERRFHKKFEVVHNMFGPEFEFSEDFSKNLPPKPIIFVSAASLVKRKGFDFLIDSFARASLPKDAWQLNIIGWGEEQHKLEKQIKDYGLENNIHLLGKMGKVEIAGQLKKSHVYVLPSRNENFSVAILEGLATGLPVLATDCGGIRECIDEKNGIIIPVDDIMAMSIAIKDIISNYSKYNRKDIALNCKNQFSPKAIATQLTEIFEHQIKVNKK